LEAASAGIEPGDENRHGDSNLLFLNVLSLTEELWISLTADLARADLSRQQALDVATMLTRGAHLLGMISEREFVGASAAFSQMEQGTTAAFVAGLNHASRVIDWSRARVLADVGIALSRYQLIEPRAITVVDEILRSGVMLPLARVLDRLAADSENQQGGGHVLYGVDKISGHMRGENPGLATGPLRILGPQDDAATLARNEIVLLDTLPPNLPPVAGVITVGSAGSLSHVSLLARNLGIPHASVGSEISAKLKQWEGQQFVVGVSSAQRRVVMGPYDKVPADRQLMLGRSLNTGAPFLQVDVDKLDLKSYHIIALDQLSASDSGVKVGPKAGELGRLRQMFPDRVSDAAVVPFGAFLRHVDRSTPEGGPSPFTRLVASYGHARGLSEEEGEKLILAQLSRFRDSIMTLAFPEGFEEEVDIALGWLGEPGSFGLFVRSDTNVEDLKEFTGAGLNRTVPNRVQREDILKAIRQVWASPFTDRAYKWRQKVLKNPEHVYPSVILHRTVPSEKSGVLVTTDLETGTGNALTISVSEGVAAVVDGGAPETIVIESDGSTRLLASSRSSMRKVIPEPPVQGVIAAPAEEHDPLLQPTEIEELQTVVAEVTRRMQRSDGVPWDIEFGLVDGHVFLFQLRPLRSSRVPATHPFLSTLDSQLKLTTGPIDLTAKLP